ncbi:Trk family potassium uptake protein [Sporanaerobium hydrogeniformans]|uniref:Trk family potassium uptake protein n=1 Tax=Sporanaerobium hydrogeniformans TaxID=3072179 RepID=A0AC61DFG9_9FIRM|nr:TrkH family potassium uptake protein [Sporanaerobium hydrogeniformans]PHV71615.1 Trk family potassium uptake protein [Sporanaerobium hydrogeniformans]
MNNQKAPGFVKMKHGTGISGHLGPSQVLVTGFLCVILIGTILLMLPISSTSGEYTSFIDALFTATSAVCVTGLTVVNTLAHWSTFGKIVIILCIQIGGLGFMTLVSMLFIIMGRRITLKNRLIMQEAFNFNTTSGIVRFTRYIVIGTLLVELTGAILMSFIFIPDYGLGKGIWYSVFHAISAFCNAGFDMIGDNSLTPYRGNILLNLTVMGLVIMGGLGFNVWIDTYKVLKLKKEKGKNLNWSQALYSMSVHTRLVWLITLGLLTLGFVFFFFAEYTNPGTLGPLSLKDKVLGAMFHSMTTRTAGFFTISLPDLTDASKLMTVLLMFIGGSPAGTAGGIKTVTIGVLILCALSTIKGKDETVVFKKRIPRQIISRALTVVIIGMMAIFIMLIILTFTENASFMDLLFEVVSAFGTVGITLGITPDLSSLGKGVIIIMMFIGRLGPITMAVALMIKQSKYKGILQYPEEKVLVG